jgi:hypothetical protein
VEATPARENAEKAQRSGARLRTTDRLLAYTNALRRKVFFSVRRAKSRKPQLLEFANITCHRGGNMPRRSRAAEMREVSLGNVCDKRHVVLAFDRSAND